MFRSRYSVSLCFASTKMCTVLLPSGVNPIAVMPCHTFCVSIYRMKQSKGTRLFKPLSSELIKYNLFLPGCW